MIAVLWKFVKGPLCGVLRFVAMAVHVCYNSAADEDCEHEFNQLVNRGT